MAKILKVDEFVVKVGMDDGSVQEIKRSEFRFEPRVGEDVQVYKDGESFIVNKLQLKSGTKVSLLVYCLLAFFIGVFGVHKFYARKTGMGIVYVLMTISVILMPIPAVLAIVDIILAVTKERDEEGNIYL